MRYYIKILTKLFPQAETRDGNQIEKGGRRQAA